MDVYNPGGSQPIPGSVPSVFNQDQSQLQLSSVQRTCSVRGCTQILLSDSTNKMCEGCRSRHRVYATTKRARRKLEKAAVAGIRHVGDQLQVSGVTASVQSQAWTQPQSTSSDNAAVNENPSTWDDTPIDPQLFAEPSAPSLHHNPIVTTYPRAPYPSSSSSELAGALTLPSSSSRNTSISVSNTNGYYQPNAVENGNGVYGTQGLAIPPPPTTGNVVAGVITQKPCSVKGCKAMIPLSSTFKMCTPCRTRYRTYGNTKRAKWRAEREAFDLELVGLKLKEDQRQTTAGEQSLSSAPEDPSMMNEASRSISENGSAEDRSNDPMTMMQTTLYPNATSTDGATYMHAVGDAPIPLPARMCTVSHCHKILPGFYRYKRCEQHRLQNRYHSHLKRIREKGEKATMLESIAILQARESESSIAGDKTSQLEGGQEEITTLSAEAEAEIGGEEAEERAESKEKKGKSRKRPSTCLTAACCNLLAPEICWRHCDVCRALKRVLRREKKAVEDNAGQGGERLEEITQLVEASSVKPKPRRLAPAKSSTGGSSEQKRKAKSASGDGAGAKEGGDQATKIAISTPVPPSASTQPFANTTSDVPASSNPTATETNDHATPYPQEFHQSVFRADIGAPSPTLGINQTPSTTTTSIPPNAATNSATIVNHSPEATSKLTIREYRPKTRVGGGPAMSPNAEAFREMVQKEQQTSDGIMAPPSYHVYKSMFPPIRPAPPAAKPPSEPKSRAPTSVPPVSEPPSEQTKSQPQEIHDGDATNNSTFQPVDTLEQDAGKSPAVSAATTTQVVSGKSQPNGEPLETMQPPPSSPSAGNTRERKSRASRPKPTPRPLATQPSATPAYPFSPPQYSYPYPYYMPPYAYSTSRPSSSSVPLTMPFPSSYPYHYPYSYTHPPGAYSPGYGYMQLPPRYPLGSYLQHQLYSSLTSQQQPYASYAYMHSKAFSSAYDQFHRSSTVAPTEETQKKRKRTGQDDELDNSAPIDSLQPQATMAQTHIVSEPNGSSQGSNNKNSSAEKPEQPPVSPTSSPCTTSRTCMHRACHRIIPTSSSGNLCERCRARIKKHLAKTKQRLKLEPRKSIIVGRVKTSVPIPSPKSHSEVEVA